MNVRLINVKHLNVKQLSLLASSRRPSLRFDLLSILAFALSVLLVPGPSAAQNEDAKGKNVRKENVRGSERLPLRHRLKRQGGAAANSAPLQKQRPGDVFFMRAAAGLSGRTNSVADVDGDGNFDILTTGTNADGNPSSTLYLGDGQGSFTAANAGLIGVAGGASTSIADVNGDGNPDLLVAGEVDESDTTNVATLYLGDGQGGFSEANAGLTGVKVSSTSIADVNGDGNPDLLITGDTRTYGDSNPTATLYLGDGQGGFTEAGASLDGAQRGSTSIADVNNDGNLDLLITGFTGTFEGIPTERATTLYFGDGQGGFNEASAGLTGVSEGSTSIADVDGDGNQDLLITGADTNGNSTTILYLGDGQGGFTEAGAGLTGVVGGSTSIADIDRDGNQDLLITGEEAGLNPTVTLYLGDGQGGFTEADAGLTDPGGTFAPLSLVEDFYGDGDQDILLGSKLYVSPINQVPPNQAPRFIRTFEYDRALAPGLTVRRGVRAGDPDGDSLTFEVPTNPNAAVRSTGIGTAAVSFTPTRSQGGDDVSISVEAEDPSGSTQSSSTSVEVSPVISALPDSLTDVDEGSTSIADVNSDGNYDLLITGNAGSLDNPSPVATLYLGNGEGGYTTADAGLDGTWQRSSTSIADVDGDQNKDLLITGQDSTGSPTSTLYLGDGQGGFTEANAGLTGVRLGSSAIGDANGDGNQDLLITGSDGSSPTATLYLGDGQGGFTESGAGLTGTRNGSASIADVDGDGNQDLLITGSVGNSPTATLYLGDGQGGFSEAGAGLTGTQNGSASIGDVNDDGHKDLLITGANANFEPTATLYFGDGQGGFAEAGAGLTGVYFRGTSAIADVDGDGNRDLLVNGYDTNIEPTATLYLGDGQGGFTKANAGFAGAAFSSISTANLDGDSDQDLLVTGFVGTTYGRSSLLYENLFDNPLPVELARFEARVGGGKVRLSWTTASETGNAGFRIQRRVVDATAPGTETSREEETGDGAGNDQTRGQTEWKQIGQVQGSGTTTESESYRFTDADLPYRADRLEYRLKQVDTDGSASYTDPLSVERSVDDVELLGTYPNPARDQVTVRYALPSRQEMSLKLYDMLGREVQTVAESTQEGRHKQTLDVGALPSGVYFLRLHSDGQTRTQKLTVVR